MKLPNKRSMQMLATLVLFATGTFIVFGQGCGIGFQSANLSSSSSMFGQCEGSPANVIDKNYEVMPNRRTASIAYGEQLLNSFVACTGIGTPSQRTKDEFERRKQSLSEYGALIDVSGAMMMAVAGVAAEVCQDLVNKERALASVDRGIFVDANLNGNGLSLTEMNSAADLLGIACWQRPPTNEEKIAITNAIGALGVNSERGALSLCTAMLSSLAAIEQ